MRLSLSENQAGLRFATLSKNIWDGVISALRSTVIAEKNIDALRQRALASRCHLIQVRPCFF